jgi:hypothetical protein
MNRNQPTRPAAVPRPAAPPPPPAPAARPANRATARRGTAAARYQPRRKSIIGRIVFWLIFLGIPGLVVASFFVKSADGRTYADLYTKPAYRWAKAKVFPPEEASEKKEAAPAAPSELDTRFDEAVAARQKAEAAVAEADAASLEKELEAAGTRIESLREIGAEAAKPAPRKTKVGTAKVVEELALQAKLQGAVSAALVKRASERDVKAALAAIPPPPPPPPPVVPYDLKKLHAWPAHPAGTWVRLKKTEGDKVTYEDLVLATLTDEVAVVRAETVPGGQATGERAYVFGSARVLREEPVKVGEAEIPCRVVQSGSTLRWIPKEGPWADRVALKVQVGDAPIVITELGEEEVPVKGETKKCLKYAVGDVTVWNHPDVPGFAARLKTPTGTAEAIDWGADLAARPAPPAPPKPVAAAPKLDPSRPHPWGSFKPGAWARRKTVFDSPTAKTETSADAVVIEVAENHVVQRIETLGPDGRLLSLEKQLPLAAAAATAAGEEILKLGASEIPCSIEESDGDYGRQKAWFAREGALAKLRVPLKIQAQRLEKSATEVQEKSMPIGGRPVQCLRIAYRGQSEDGALQEELVVSEEVPGFEVVRETTVQTTLGQAHTSFTLIDFGSDAAKKTSLALVAETPVQVEERRVKRLLAEAEQLTIEGGAILREVINAMKDPPLVPEKLQALLTKTESASSMLVKARESYVSAKEKAADPAPIEEKLGKLGRALELAAKYTDSIKGRLK